MTFADGAMLNLAAGSVLLSSIDASKSEASS
jgi:hypothetical protein